MKKTILLEKKVVSVTWVQVDIQENDDETDVINRTINEVKDEGNCVDWSKSYEHISFLSIE